MVYTHCTRFMPGTIAPIPITASSISASSFLKYSGIAYPQWTRRDVQQSRKLLLNSRPPPRKGGALPLSYEPIGFKNFKSERNDISLTLHSHIIFHSHIIERI